MTYIYLIVGVLANEFVQPPIFLLNKADSTEINSVDGESGEFSLEKTDAKTAAPSLKISSQFTSMSQKIPDLYGPKGQKEK